MSDTKQVKVEYIDGSYKVFANTKQASKELNLHRNQVAGIACGLLRVGNLSEEKFVKSISFIKHKL